MAVELDVLLLRLDSQSQVGFLASPDLLAVPYIANHVSQLTTLNEAEVIATNSLVIRDGQIIDGH